MDLDRVHGRDGPGDAADGVPGGFLQKVRFDNAAATTTDVLDSESAVSRARLAFALPRYDYYLALVALACSIGDLPTQRIQ